MFKGCAPMTNYTFDPIFCIAWHFHMPQRKQLRSEKSQRNERELVRLDASFPFQSHDVFNETDHYRFMWHLIKMFAIGRTYFMFIWMAAVFFSFACIFMWMKKKSASYAKNFTQWAVIVWPNPRWIWVFEVREQKDNVKKSWSLSSFIRRFCQQRRNPFRQNQRLSPIYAISINAEAREMAQTMRMARKAKTKTIARNHLKRRAHDENVGRTEYKWQHTQRMNAKKRKQMRQRLNSSVDDAVATSARNYWITRVLCLFLCKVSHFCFLLDYLPCTHIRCRL